MSTEAPSPNELPDLQMPQLQAGDVYEIPAEGSLGLLALGAAGLKLWREKRNAAIAAAREAQQSNPPSSEETKTNRDDA